MGNTKTFKPVGILDLLYSANFLFWPVSRLFTKRVLVVEDDSFMKPFLDRIIRTVDEGVEMAWADNLNDARDFIQKQKFDLVILDCLLGPNEDSLELLDHIRARTPRTPILMISGLEVREVRKRANEKGVSRPKGELVSGFLRKPFSAQEFKGWVGDLLGTAN